MDGSWISFLKAGSPHRQNRWRRLGAFNCGGRDAKQVGGRASLCKETLAEEISGRDRLANYWQAEYPICGVAQKGCAHYADSVCKRAASARSCSGESFTTAPSRQM